MLDHITPIILTYNEAPNIGRALDRLAWAKSVIVVDSLSDDETLDIVRRYPNTTVFERAFVSHTDQWTYAISETGIATPWAMRLSADFILTDALIDEMRGLNPEDDVAAYNIRFIYAIFGKHLRASAYPPGEYLFRPDRCAFYDEGHGEKLRVDGRALDLAHPIVHDDRKPLERFFAAQSRYMRLESAKLGAAKPADLNRADRIRRRRYLAPFLVLFYCLFWKRLILDGKAGIYYSLQRFIAELTLSLYLLDGDLRTPSDTRDDNA